MYSTVTCADPENFLGGGGGDPLSPNLDPPMSKTPLLGGWACFSTNGVRL